MAVYALGDAVPKIHETAYVHPDAVIIGEVTIGPQSSVWPGAVIRGDDGPITIGARTSVQDNCVLHTVASSPTTVGDDVTLGHLAHLEGCTIHSGSLVGVGAVVLHRAVVHTGALVAANATVLDDMVVPAGALAVGTPARIKEGAVRPEIISDSAAHYVERLPQYSRDLRRID